MDFLQNMAASKKKEPIKALLIIDVQNGFVTPEMNGVIRNIEQAQHEYDHVFATRFINPPGSPHRRFIKWLKFDEGSNETMLAFTPKENAVVIEKSIYSCVNEEFMRMLKKNKITEVHICGIETEICVTKCAVDLFERGVRPVVLTSLCASKHSELREAALHILGRFIGSDQLK